MNSLSKDLLFYSNYCLHSNNLINTISKTSLHNNIIYICIDEKKVKIPSFITRVPTIYLVKEKILVEDDIDRWFEMQQRNSQPQQNNMPQHNNMPQQNSMPQQNNMPQQTNISQEQNPSQANDENEGIMAYHMNEMGNSMSNSYSFISDDNSSLNHNFEFLDGNTNSSGRINTPKEFTKTENPKKTKLDSDFDKLLQSRNNESFAKGIERV